VKVTVAPIRDNSHGVRIWLKEEDGTPDSGADIDTMAVLEPLSQYDCEVTLTKGELSDEANIRIGLKALALGYHRLHFHRAAGGPVSRWAKYQKTVNGMDYYTVDLRAAAAELGL
jgi:hypothetical protein